MVSQAIWYGGSQTVSGTATLGMNSPRVIRSTGGLSPVITLPDLTNVILDPRDYGGPRFIIIRQAIAALTVEDADTTTIATLANNKVAEIYLRLVAGVPTWKAVVRTINTVRAVGKGARGALVAETAVATFDPGDLFCFVGTDCEFSNADPLDGQDGRETALAPMFLNPCLLAHNDNREAIRGADVIMPTNVVVTLTPGCFDEDAAHPLTQTMPDAFFDVLYNGGNPHLLAYDHSAKVSNGDARTISRNPYHMRRKKATHNWDMGTVNTTKLFWKKQLSYTVGIDTFTIDLVFQVEHTANPEPTVTADNQQLPPTWSFGAAYEVDDPVVNDGAHYKCTAAHTATLLNEPGVGASWESFWDLVATNFGGPHDVDDGIYGALFSLYIFSDQIAPGFNDGDTHTPAGGGSPVQFWRDDPLVWGSAPGVAGGGDGDKFSHPQLMAAAVLPTTMHDPCKFEWIPFDEEATIRGTGDQGLNRAWAHRRPNCVPWITDPDRDIPNVCTNCGLSEGIRQNTHFTPDNDVSGNPWGAMTTGGDLPKSRPTELLCWENGGAIGRTFLKPAHAGWDEVIGELADTPSCGTIQLCIDWDNSWPEYAFESCDGHPAELFHGVGGTHRCFKNNSTGAATQCCIQLATGDPLRTDELGYIPTPVHASWSHKCTEEWTQFGGRSGGACDVEDFGCDVIGTFRTTARMELYDYQFGTTVAPVANRQLHYRAYGVDPDATLFSYTYDQADVADMNQIVGSWAFGATITTTPAGIETLTSILQYDPTRAGIDGDWRDAICTVQFKNCTNITHGVGMRMRDDGGNDAFGYGAYIEPTGVDTGNAVIAEYTNGVETILVTKAIVLDADVVDVVLRVWGTNLRFSYTVSGGESGVLETDDCEYIDGGSTGTPTLFTKSTGATAEFDGWIIVDESYQYLFHSAELQDHSISITGRTELMDSYNQCEAFDTSCCGSCCDPECCNCRTWGEGLWATMNASWGGPGDLTDDTAPTYCGGPPDRDCFSIWCGDNVSPSCGQCPPPWPCINLCFPTRCFDDRPGRVTFHYAPEDEPNICKGLTFWCDIGKVCF